ncbi:hypothetical protein [Lentzea sp. E54]|uniref:hypothetical protein n=1 Tax=Lentzea xerophila TaxID=3435883 RepID=UPI003DA6B411
MSYPFLGRADAAVGLGVDLGVIGQAGMSTGANGDDLVLFFARARSSRASSPSRSRTVSMTARTAGNWTSAGRGQAGQSGCC